MQTNNSEVKIYEGENLQELIYKAKEELGENVKILHYEEIVEKSWWFPFRKKKKFKLFVEKQEEVQKQTPEINFDELLSKVEEMIEEKIKMVYQPIEVPECNVYKASSELDLEEFTGESIDLIHMLIKKGVEPEYAKEIVRSSCGLDIDTNKLDLTFSTFEEALINGFKENISFFNNFDLSADESKFKVLTFVGPTGVGKTTNLFKIASDFILNKNLKVGVISTDTFKVGAVEQARFYANVLNIPFYTLSDYKNLRKTLLELSNMDVVLIDTVGRSHYDSWRLAEIKEILKGGMEWLDCILTISCNYSYTEAINVVNKYKSYFPVRYLLFTKIDESSNPSLIVNLAMKTKLPVTYISVGQRVPEDIKILTPKLLASYFLEEMHE